MLHGGDSVRVDVDHAAFDVLNEAFEEVVGRRAVQVRSGGSIPIVPELGLAGAPVILTGIGLPDDGLHSPNEKLDLGQLWSGIRIFGQFASCSRRRGGAVPEPEEDGEEERRGAQPPRPPAPPASSAGVARLGAGVQLVHPDERPHRGDDPPTSSAQ
jgi:hypothetical protein